MAPDLRGQLNGHDPGSLLRESFATAPRADVLGGMIAADVAVILPDDFLVKVDRASMAHGLEVRPPLLDHELHGAGRPDPLAVEGPATARPSGSSSRPIGQLLPDDDPPPAEAGLRDPDRCLAPRPAAADVRVGGPRSETPGSRSLIDQDVARRIYRSPTSAGTGRQGNMLWSLLVLARWAERYLKP